MTTRKTYPRGRKRNWETLKELYPDNDNEYIGRLLNRTSGERKRCAPYGMAIENPMSLYNAEE